MIHQASAVTETPLGIYDIQLRAFVLVADEQLSELGLTEVYGRLVPLDPRGKPIDLCTGSTVVKIGKCPLNNPIISSPSQIYFSAQWMREWT